ncbi:uncharacterized protein LOC119838542 [Zerene cesonia]|uniref:uncharacterized protein LOC119838542 n=1 Tax=Zerene cesonia TaxID=33412 RepID=UPI0018E52FD1|nr:uncharacterized protein LOC119838542 [Zerene cesonia]
MEWFRSKRKYCLRCGRSPTVDPEVKLFRFPHPGTRNVVRCELWARYCFPNERCTTEFQKKLYMDHEMLCDRHFNKGSFVDFECTKLKRCAVPEEIESDNITLTHLPKKRLVEYRPMKVVDTTEMAVLTVSPETLTVSEELCTMEEQRNMYDLDYLIIQE